MQKHFFNDIGMLLFYPDLRKKMMPYDTLHLLRGRWWRWNMGVFGEAGAFSSPSILPKDSHISPPPPASTKPPYPSHNATTISLKWGTYKCLFLAASDIYFIGGFGTVAWVDVKEYEMLQPDKIAVDGGEQNLKVTHRILANPPKGKRKRRKKWMSVL
jgi:hypothetical protein